MQGSTCDPVGVGEDSGVPVSGPPPAGGDHVATPTAAASTAPSPAVKAGTSVAIKDYAFTPATLTIPAGTTVTWTNNDTVPHTATASDGSFDSGNLNPGQSFSFTFATPGSYPYVCQYHAGMKGTIVVQ